MADILTCFAALGDFGAGLMLVGSGRFHKRGDVDSRSSTAIIRLT